MKKILLLLLAVSVLCSCNNGKPTDTSGTSYIENPFETTAPITEPPLTTTEEKTELDLAREEYEKYRPIGMRVRERTCNGVTAGVYIENFDTPCEYNGGTVKFSADIEYKCRAEVKAEFYTVGIMMTIEGIVQEISVNGSEPTEFYIYTIPTNGWGSSDFETLFHVDIEFTPEIAEEDIDKESLCLRLNLAANPHYETPLVHFGTPHNNWIVSGITMNVKTPIENITDKKRFDVEIKEELITSSVMRKYSKVRSATNFELTRADVVDDTVSNIVSMTEDGKTEVGFVFTAKTAGTYRIFYIVNTRPVPFADGSDYIEIEAEPGYVYTIDPVLIPDVGVHDSIDVLVYGLSNENGDVADCDDSNFPSVIETAEEGKESATMQPWS